MGRIVAWARMLMRRPLDLFGFAALFVYSAPTFAYPIITDQPIHWYIGRDILSGHLPYETAISTKAPLTFVIHAIGIALFGEGMWVVRLIDLFFLALGAALIATMRPQPARGMPRRAPPDGEAGAAAMLLGGFLYTYFDWSDTGHPETWQGVLVLLSAWIVVRAPEFRVSPRRAFAAGAVACLAVTIKHIGVVPGVVIGGAATFLPARPHPVAYLKNAGAYTLGTLVVMGAMLGVFWLGGGWDEFYDIMVVHIFRYADESLMEFNWTVPWMVRDQGLPAVAAGLIGLGAGLAVAWAGLMRRERVLGVFFSLLLLSVAGAAALPRRALYSHNFSYYWLFLVPFLALSVAWGLRLALGRTPLAQVVIAACLVAAAFLSAPRGSHLAEWNYQDEWVSWVAHVRGERSFHAHHARHKNTRNDSYVHITDLAGYIRSRMRPGDSLCHDGFVVGLYLLTGMRCNSRYIIGDPAPPYRAMQLRALEADPPRFFVTFGDRPGRRRQLRRLGYREHEVRFPDDGAWFVVAELPRE